MILQLFSSFTLVSVKIFGKKLYLSKIFYCNDPKKELAKLEPKVYEFVVFLRFDVVSCFPEEWLMCLGVRSQGKSPQGLT